ncbi:hypothetical protein DNK34_21340 [Pseudomonas dryadis]|uniref:Uncharacterized protein n=2 Tax=Pseudomonadales TaxID=72274 RepID=A0A4Q9R579_9GAMM|nr:hypothetical protein DNK44_06810 [Pseudomonas dryadis]TBV01380.1 hypothetical protein DNK34_21340 [Pseudomonas dryadis]TBV14134.1 hypothetical protein DNK41_20935 [Pseudomonas sp. FRB 230]
MLVALLGLAMTGCAVYGDSSGSGYRGYDRQYYPGVQVQRYPLYAAPRVYVYEDRRYHAPPRHYAPPPVRYLPKERGFDPRYHGRHDRNSRDYRPAPRPGWEGQRHHYQQQQRQRGAALQWQPRETPQRFQRGWEQRR